MLIDKSYSHLFLRMLIHKIIFSSFSITFRGSADECKCSCLESLYVARGNLLRKFPPLV